MPAKGRQSTASPAASAKRPQQGHRAASDRHEVKQCRKEGEAAQTRTRPRSRERRRSRVAQASRYEMRTVHRSCRVKKSRQFLAPHFTLGSTVRYIDLQLASPTVQAKVKTVSKKSLPILEPTRPIEIS